MFLLSFFVLSCLNRFAHSVPLHFGETVPFMEDPRFLRALKQSQSLVNKVLKDIPAAYKSCVDSENFTLQPSGQPKILGYMVTSLAIPSPPVLKDIPADFTLETCLNHISKGLQMHLDLLKAVHGRVSNPEKLTELQADIRDLLAQIKKMRELGHMESTVQYSSSGLASRLIGDYKVQVATHFILSQLQTFTQNVFRSLNYTAELITSQKQ